MCIKNLDQKMSREVLTRKNKEFEKLPRKSRQIMTKIVSEGFKKWPKLATLLPREKSFEHTEGMPPFNCQNYLD